MEAKFSSTTIRKNDVYPSRSLIDYMSEPTLPIYPPPPPPPPSPPPPPPMPSTQAHTLSVAPTYPYSSMATAQTYLPPLISPTSSSLGYCKSQNISLIKQLEDQNTFTAPVSQWSYPPPPSYGFGYTSSGIGGGESKCELKLLIKCDSQVMRQSHINH